MHTPAVDNCTPSRYHRHEVERLRERKEIRRDPAKAAARGLHWGSPVLSSGLTLISGGKLYYRGLDALKLAESASLEEVANLLWGTDESDGEQMFQQRCPLSPSQLKVLLAKAKLQGRVATLQSALPLAGVMDPASYDLRPAAVRQTGARILRLLVTIAAGRHSRGNAGLERSRSLGITSRVGARKTSRSGCNSGGLSALCGS